MAQLNKWITCDRGIICGKPVIKGTCISVELILRCMASGMTMEDILKGYPSLRKESVLATLRFAAGQMSVTGKSKIIGKMVKPGKDSLGKISEKEAEIVNDTIKFPHLSLSAIYDALSYYYNHTEEIERSIGKNKEERIRVEICNDKK